MAKSYHETYKEASAFLKKVDELEVDAECEMAKALGYERAVDMMMEISKAKYIVKKHFTELIESYRKKGKSFSDIAKILKMPEAEVRSRLYKSNAYIFDQDVDKIEEELKEMVDKEGVIFFKDRRSDEEITAMSKLNEDYGYVCFHISINNGESDTRGVAKPGTSLADIYKVFSMKEV